MTDTLHPREHLSAYLDGALTPAERAAVDTHLDTCPDCRARVAELRGVATLLRSLPGPVPSRRLVPRLATAPLWMAPLRTLATLASGVSVFLFMASAILANIGFLAGGSASTAASGAAAVAPQAASQANVTSQDRAAASAGPTSDAKAAPTAPGAFAATTPGPTPVPPTNAYAAQVPEQHSAPGIAVGPSPWVWLVLAIVTGIIALALQRRLRSI